MRSLTLKLTLAFLTVGLVGALLVALFVGQRTQTAFDQFVGGRRQAAMIDELSRYYQAHGTWDGVRQMFDGESFQASNGPAHGPQVVVVAPDGNVVLGNGRFPTGARVPLEPGRALPIDVNGETVGFLVDDRGFHRPGPGTPEADLLTRINDAIIYGAVGAVGIALLLGLLLARTLTHPIRELTVATQAVAKGALGRQVSVRSSDELGTLATSFNQMSADLEHASTLRRQMTADIAHDLRTPLSVILGYTEALRDGKLPGHPDIYETMHIEAQHLQHLIDDLRTLSLADAGELPLNRQPSAPQSLLDRTAAAYAAQARVQEIALAVAGATDLPEVYVDQERVAQVLGNLVNNALRYTPAGGRIMLAAEARSRTVEFRVEDTGSGIAPDALPHVFERFYRADPSRQQDGSSGLGLAIARSIVEAHNGRIAVESIVGQGTTFRVDLPVAERSDTPLDDRKQSGARRSSRAASVARSQSTR